MDLKKPNLSLHSSTDIYSPLDSLKWRKHSTLQPIIVPKPKNWNKFIRLKHFFNRSATIFPLNIHPYLCNRLLGHWRGNLLFNGCSVSMVMGLTPDKSTTSTPKGWRVISSLVRKEFNTNLQQMRPVNDSSTDRTSRTILQFVRRPYKSQSKEWSQKSTCW